MNILFVSSEVAPFAKTGGLGDVGAALPKALAKHGHDVRVVLPYYRRVREGGHEAQRLFGKMFVDLGPYHVGFEVWETRLYPSDGGGREVPVYLVDCPPLYDRRGIYTQDPDEHLRFALLNWAALMIAQQLRFAPDIVHANDWQSALLPMMLRTVFAWDKNIFGRSRSLLTIHNIGHQGTFGAHVLPELGLESARGAFHQDNLKAGRLSFLLTGIQYANAITTVSPTYAREIQTPEHGVGLDAFLRARGDVMMGVLNGIDEELWTPERDPYIPHAFTASDMGGKLKNKERLLGQMGLPFRRNTPVIGIVSRLAWQKGFDLCFEALPALLRQRDVQIVVLGSGEPKYEQLFRELSLRAPTRVAFKNGFSEPLAHLIEAGSDMFLMPSRYEPCGLNQMYSLANGTVPIVHKTGGLADTVTQFDARTGQGNGFVFDHFDVTGLKWALGYALECYHRPEVWSRIVQNGMREDFSWARRVRDYERIYGAIAA